MIMAERKKSLEDVLNEYLATESEPSYEALERWAKRFPEYKDELSEFTVSWSKAENALEPNVADVVDEETLVLRAMSIVGDRLHALHPKKQESKADLTNLMAEAKKNGLTIKELAKLSELSVPIVSKISRGFLDPLTVPKLVVERLAAALNRTAEGVAFLMQYSSMSAGGVFFKSKEQPELPKNKENFFDAVRNDRELDEKQKKFWLELEHKHHK